MKKITIPIPDTVFQYCHWGDGGCPVLVDLEMLAENESLTNSPMIRKGRGYSHSVSADLRVWKFLLEDLDFHGDYMPGSDFPSCAKPAHACRQTADKIRNKLGINKET